MAVEIPLGLLIALAYGGSTLATQVGKWGERGVQREQIRSTEKISKSQAEASERLTKEAQKRAEEYMKEILKTRRVEKRESKEAELTRMFMGSQDRQMAMILQAIQGMTRPRGSALRGSGMLSVMRGGF